jgi:hypothetical protein
MEVEMEVEGDGEGEGVSGMIVGSGRLSCKGG